MSVKIGALVSHAKFADRDGIRGVVVATETYTDATSSREYVYVRWISHEGRPDGDPQRLWTWEIRAVEGGAA